LLVEPFMRKKSLEIKRVPYALFLTSLIFSPMIHHQYSGYRVFCQETDTPASWCSNLVPSIYTYVQSKYWNVGILDIGHCNNSLISCLPHRFLDYCRTIQPSPSAHSPAFSLTRLNCKSLLPLILYPSRRMAFMPRLLVEHPRLGKWWVGWSVVWGAVSLVLWWTFLPPA